MSNEIFDELPPELQRTVIKGLLGELFGEAQVESLWQQLEPVVGDRLGHADRRLAGETPDPKDNFWNGVWQVHDAD